MALSGSGIIGGCGGVAGAAGRQRLFPARRHVAVQLVVFDQRSPAHFQTPPARTGQEARATSQPAGRRAEKREPRPGSRSTVISPPIIWQNFLLSASPKPVPLYFRVAEPSTCEKGWNSLPRCSRPIPMPVSETCTSVHSPSPLRTLFTATETRPLSVNFRALFTRFSTLCRNLERSA